MLPQLMDRYITDTHACQDGYGELTVADVLANEVMATLIASEVKLAHY